MFTRGFTIFTELCLHELSLIYLIHAHRNVNEKLLGPMCIIVFHKCLVFMVLRTGIYLRLS